jgi:hypothetical protein
MIFYLPMMTRCLFISTLRASLDDSKAEHNTCEQSRNKWKIHDGASVPTEIHQPARGETAASQSHAAGKNQKDSKRIQQQLSS